MRNTRRGFFVLLSLAVACGSPPSVPPTQIAMSFARQGGLYDAPFPSDDLRRADGTIDLSRFPNPDSIKLVEQALSLAGAAKGFAQAGGVFFQATGPIATGSLPDIAASRTPSSSVFLMSVTPGAADYGERYPVLVAFAADGGPFGAPDLLSLVPLQGVPLRPSTTYAAVVTTALHDAAGAALAPSPAMRQLAAGAVPTGMPTAAGAAYLTALAELGKLGVASSAVAGLAVFTTGDSTDAVRVVVNDLLSRPLPVPDAPFTTAHVYPEFCVYTSTIAIPDYQSGTPPFQTTGGTWQFDASGAPVLQRTEEATIEISIPRSTAPPGGYPIVVFERAGGGTSNPLVERGPMATNGGPPITPGTGPALQFARAGFAGLQVDGPLEGLRNSTGGDEDSLIFNILNPGALRDNVRESAVELALDAHIIAALSLDVTSCPGAGASDGGKTVRFDTTRMAAMGHSMGAWILPVAVAHEPMLHALVLSGAGGSYIDNVMYKQTPMNIRPLAELILGYGQRGESLTPNDPVLSLVEWAAEPSDPQVYGRYVTSEPLDGAAPRHVLMVQGIVDHYILPDIANATSLSIGLDLGGPELDGDNAELMMDGQTPVGALLPLVGRKALSLPVAGNVGANGAAATAVLVQWPSDGIEDGHEVLFQTDPPKHQYRCFLASFARGAPSVPAGGAADAPCP